MASIVFRHVCGMRYDGEGFTYKLKGYLMRLFILCFVMLGYSVVDVCSASECAAFQGGEEMVQRNPDDNIRAIPFHGEVQRPTISALRFKILDDESELLRNFRVTYRIDSRALDHALEASKIELSHDHGILTIPEPVPKFGYIRLWVDADNLDDKYIFGLAEFSYHLSDQPTDLDAEPTPIELKKGVVLTGRVLDDGTQLPIVGAQVAPLVLGSHFPYAVWSQAVQTDDTGYYRLPCAFFEGVAARHDEYGEDEIETSDREINLLLSRNLYIPCRLIDAAGNPIRDAAVSNSWVPTDDTGRCLVAIHASYAQDPEHQISLVIKNHVPRKARLSELSPERENVIAFDAEPLIRGTVIDEQGNAIEDCIVQVKFNYKHTVNRYHDVPGPYPQGKWEVFSPEVDSLSVRVLQDGVVRLTKELSSDEAIKVPVLLQLGRGYSVTAQLKSKAQMHLGNIPRAWVLPKDQIPFEVPVTVGGFLNIDGLLPGEYTLLLAPQGSDRYSSYGYWIEDSSHWYSKSWTQEFLVEDTNVSLNPIDVDGLQLLATEVNGTVLDGRTVDGSDSKPLANYFGYVCDEGDTMDLHGGVTHITKFMTDADGNFSIPSCPPGNWVLRFSTHPAMYRVDDRAASVKVEPGTKIQLRFFRPD